MLHFLQFLEFLVGLVVLALALVLNYDLGFSGWPIANVLLLTAGACAVFVVLVSHFFLRRAARPSVMVVVLHVLECLLAIATFVYCFMHFPYKECVGVTSKGCKVDKAAVPMDGVLMGLFFITSAILLYDFICWNKMSSGSGVGGKRRVGRWYY